MQDKLQQILKSYSDKINQASTLGELDNIFLSLFGKNGEITLLPKQFASLPKDELKTIGPLFNQVKNSLEQQVEQKRQLIREAGYQKLIEESVDLSNLPEIKSRVGHLNPLTQFEREIVEIFKGLGFQQFDAPYIDTDHNNFEVLNIPDEHPARDLWDTLYVDGTKYGFEPGKLLMRTHTSNSQIHIMETYKPPIRMMTIGSCFRYENIDARHEHTFDQFELVYIDKGLSMANLQYLSEYFLKQVYGEDIKVRLRPKYYPFVEPGAGVDGQCVFCKDRVVKFAAVQAGLSWPEPG